MKQKQERNVSLDMLRVLVIFLIVLSHVMLHGKVIENIEVFTLLETANLGVYAIAGVSSVYSLIRNFIFATLYGAHCLDIKKSTFYHEIITGNISLIINLVNSFAIYKMLTVNGWIVLVVACVIAGILCLSVNVLIVLSKDERKMVKKLVDEKIGRR